MPCSLPSQLTALPLPTPGANLGSQQHPSPPPLSPRQPGSWKGEGLSEGSGLGVSERWLCLGLINQAVSLPCVSLRNSGFD